MADVQGNIHNVFDLTAMLVDAFDRDTGASVRMFSEPGEPQFKGPEKSGLMA